MDQGPYDDPRASSSGSRAAFPPPPSGNEAEPGPAGGVPSEGSTPPTHTPPAHTPPAHTPPAHARGAGSNEPAPRRGSRRGLAVVATAILAAVVGAGAAVPMTLALVDDGSESASEPSTPGEPVGRDEPADPSDSGDGSGESASPIADVADELVPSVARVDVGGGGGLQPGGGGGGSGSAVVYREDGYLLTNAHVVGDADTVEVTLPDGTRADADVIGREPTTDIAVLELDGGSDLNLPVPDFAENLPRVGETAIAIGSPFGLDATVTTGVVSAVGRNVPDTPLTDVIQTDAPINPGNSGGPLVNGNGEVIGINTAIIGPQRTNIGIGFAVPITNAVPIADQLIETGEVRFAQLGVRGQNVDPRTAELYGLETREGAVVVEVEPGSGADEAGLQQGDIIVGFDGEDVTSFPELAGMVRAHEPGDTVTLEILRSDERLELEATLGEGRAQ